MGQVEYNYEDLMFFLGQLCASAAQLNPDDSELCNQYALKVRELLEDISWYVNMDLRPEKEEVHAESV